MKIIRLLWFVFLWVAFLPLMLIGCLISGLCSGFGQGHRGQDGG